MITGYLTFEENEYTFIYDDNAFLTLVSKRENEYYFGRSASFLSKPRPHMQERLCGITSDNQSICFLKCRLTKFSWNYSCNYKWRPAAYIISKNNLSNQESGLFHAVNFKGGIVNGFYPPHISINREETRYDSNGTTIISLKPFSETTRNIKFRADNENLDIQFSISVPGMKQSDTIELGTIISAMKIEFVEAKSVGDVIDIYSYWHSVFSFLNFNKGVSFGEVSLLFKHRDGSYEPRWSFHITRSENLTSSSNMAKAINLECFSDEQFISLVKAVTNKGFYNLFIPQNKNEMYVVDPHKYLACCASFESMYKSLYVPLNEANDDFNYVREKLTEVLLSIDKEFKGKNGARRQYAERFKETIERESYSLAEQFRKTLKEYTDIIHSIIANARGLNPDTQENENQMAEKFSNHRNRLAHGDYHVFENIHIAAYLIARAIIYVMVFKKAGLDDAAIKELVNTLFL